MTTYTKDQVDAKIVEFVAKLNEFVSSEQARNFPGLKLVYKIEIENGSKNARIVRREYTVEGEKISGSVHCFIDRSTGDIKKAAGYKAPAPNGVRGNIFTSPNMGIGIDNVVGVYGCAYLR